MPTRSKDLRTYGTVDGQTKLTIQRKSDGVLIGNTTTNRSLIAPNKKDLGWYESQTYATGPKTSTLSVDGFNIEVPVFKSIVHSSSYVTKSIGMGFVRYGENSSYRFTYSNTGCAEAVKDWKATYTISKLVSMGLCHDPASLRTIFSAQALPQLKDMLSSSELLNFSDGFNVLSFIGELRDVKRLPELITKWYKHDKILSDKALGMQFGLLPFASDVRAIADRSVQLGPSIDKWNAMAASGTIRNYHRNLNFSPVGENVGSAKQPVYEASTIVNESGTSFINGTYPGVSYKIYGKHTVRQEVSGLAHLYALPRTIPPDLVDNIKRDVWGVNKPLTALWNLLPFSFVVDWFVNIGDHIATFEAAKPDLPVQVVNAGWSYKVTTTHTMSFGTVPTGNDSSLGTITSKYVTYERVPISPMLLISSGAIYGPLQFRSLSTAQALLGSALLHQRLR